ncbi:hypothetical protein [Rhizobium sp. GN54]|uniref:hypothetical protein n=1 Tax=Rhizobium sp. GN54 TaxID=2898150 RepID=UPI001E4173BF|nr:hypothetical protein [Rhizobium sp. GN54]MCD2183658.1 hypothetical protein [Rhizobium sp. GN54]
MKAIVIPAKHHAEASRIYAELNRITDRIKELAQAAELSTAAIAGAGREVMDMANRQSELYSRLEELSRDVD